MVHYAFLGCGVSYKCNKNTTDTAPDILPCLLMEIMIQRFYITIETCSIMRGVQRLYNQILVLRHLLMMRLSCSLKAAVNFIHQGLTPISVCFYVVIVAIWGVFCS
ncbi:MAG: hypothetical protein H8D87_01890 [Deltaproteobacteria bacterium]|nr:hypothetical protein [Candidatus Desulfobacula maris]